MLRRKFVAAVLVAGLGAVGAGVVLADESEPVTYTTALSPPVTEVHPDAPPPTPKPPATAGYESPGRPQWKIGEDYEVVPRDDPAWDLLSARAREDPSNRLCRHKRTGRIIRIITDAAPGQDPYPPEDTNRPC